MEDLFLGIDLGGTGKRAAIYNSQGIVIYKFNDVNYSKMDNYELVGCMQGLIGVALRESKNKGSLVAWGLASPGPLDPHKGIIECPPNLRVKNFAVVEYFEKRLPNLRGYLLNDADARLLGEHQWGAAKGFKHVIGIFPGTGLGTACISNYRLQRGRGKGGGWGHNTICGLDESRKCVCGRVNCWEAFCGTYGLAQTYRKVFKITDELKHDQIFQISKNIRNNPNDDRVKAVLALYASHLCEGLVNMVCAYHPELIVLGGGIIEGNDLLLQYIKKRVAIEKRKSTSSGALLEGVSLAVSSLEKPGVMGAAAYAMQNYRRYKFDFTESV